MKFLQYLPVSLLLLVFISCDQSSSTETEGSEVDLSGFEHTDIPGSKAQILTKMNESDILVEEGLLQNGIRTGLWVTYHNAGKQIPKKMANYSNGQLNGLVTEFNTRGGLTSAVHYLNGTLHGTSISYRNGRLVEWATYKMGVFDGPYRTYFEHSDQIQKELIYKDKELHGLIRFFNEEGEVILQYTYENGERIEG